MTLYLTGAHSSRVTKSGSKPNLRRSTSSPLRRISKITSASRQNSLTKALDDTAATDDEDDDIQDVLRPTGKIVSTVSVASAKDVISAMNHATTSMFCALPERAGMNSVRIAEVLNFQKNMPPLVSLAHVHALISASSRTEREIQSLSAQNRLRRVKVAGRGNDVSGLGEMLILMSDYEKLLHTSGLPPETISLFSEILQQNPRASTIPSHSLRSAHLTTLTKHGFLVGASLSGTRNVSLSGSTLVSMPTISRGASGTSAAVGGEAAFEHLGGVGVSRRSTSEPYVEGRGIDLSLSVPNLGPYLRLISAGRNHLLDLLRASKHKQAPMYLLRERWDGAIDNDNRVSTAKRLRGEFSAVLPAKTKKWKDLNGLSFDWALEECLGAGLIELFETHSVGYGVRALT